MVFFLLLLNVILLVLGIWLRLDGPNLLAEHRERKARAAAAAESHSRWVDEKLYRPSELDCAVWEIRQFENKLLEAGIIKPLEVTLCDESDCPSCKSIRLKREYRAKEIASGVESGKYSKYVLNGTGKLERPEEWYRTKEISARPPTCVSCAIRLEDDNGILCKRCRVKMQRRPYDELGFCLTCDKPGLHAHYTKREEISDGAGNKIKDVYYKYLKGEEFTI